MALKVGYDIRCSCGEVFSAEVYEYVFVQHDPELKDAILSADFNRVPCPACGERLAVESPYLYRDERNRLWVWVRSGKERYGNAASTGENTFLDFHSLDHQETYRRRVVSGRDGLLELLWAEDPELRRAERKGLKENPAFWVSATGNPEPGFILFTGRRIRISLPLRFPGPGGTRLKNRKERARWLKAYAHGLNAHNRFTSFLDARSISKWNRIRRKEPLEGAGDAFADFAESWASRKVDARGFAARCPARHAFFDGLEGLKISRKLRSLDSGTAPRRSGGSR